MQFILSAVPWRTVRLLTIVDIVLKQRNNCLPNNKWLGVKYVLNDLLWSITAVWSSSKWSQIQAISNKKLGARAHPPLNIFLHHLIFNYYPHMPLTCRKSLQAISSPENMCNLRIKYVFLENFSEVWHDLFLKVLALHLKQLLSFWIKLLSCLGAISWCDDPSKVHIPSTTQYSQLYGVSYTE